MVRRHINKIKRTYTRARGIFGASKFLQNPLIIGAITGVFKNVMYGQPPLNIKDITWRVTQPSAKNPLIYILAGYFLKNKPLMAIGACLIVDPPVSDDIHTMSNEEIEALSEEIEAKENQRICIH